MSRARKSPVQAEEPDHAPPQAACLAESLRAFPYELPTALADLVDNSLTARARNVWLDFHWDGADSVIAITDDGDGMTEEKLRAAMRPGSQSPLVPRETHDLGRFGLGLKTASFSQARRFSVRSRPGKSDPATRCWDLDHIALVNDWQLLRSADSAAEPHLARLAKLPPSSGKSSTASWLATRQTARSSRISFSSAPPPCAPTSPWCSICSWAGERA